MSSETQSKSESESENSIHRAVRTLVAVPSLLSLDADASGGFAMGCLVAVLGFDDRPAALSGSAYARYVQHQADEPASLGGQRSEADLERDEHTALCRELLLEKDLCTMARPVGPGGLVLSLAAACIRSETEVGCALVLPAPRLIGAADPPSIEQQIFHEAPGRYLLAIHAHKQAEARILVSQHGVPLWPLGRTGGRELVIRASEGDAFREVVRLPIVELVAASRPKTAPAAR